MLRLNPNDSMGVRYRLINALLRLGRDREAGKLDWLTQVQQAL